MSALFWRYSVHGVPVPVCDGLRGVVVQVPRCRNYRGRTMRPTQARPAVGSRWRMAVCKYCGDDIANYGMGWVHRGVVGVSQDELCSGRSASVAVQGGTET